MATILILDDELPLLHSLTMALQRAGHQCLPAETGRQALSILKEHSIDLAILDVHLPDISGLDVLRSLRADVPEVPAIVITAFSSVETAVEAMKEGARDYLEKPLDLEELLLVVDRELTTARMRTEVEAWRRQSEGQLPRDPAIVGDSPAMERVRRLVQQMAGVSVEQPGDLPSILLRGETGTGKDLLARTLHETGPLKGKPFVQVNCAGLPRDLVESELFGHERGAFTSATTAKQGLFEVARGGTVYLDEIGHMPLDLQAKLLTVLESKRLRRIGGTREHPIEARIIAATNRDLEAAVEAGEFRADLYYRLKVLQILLPPLRERPEDIPALAEHFLERYRRKYGRPELVMDQGLRRTLLAWHWPGNVRELAHTLEQMVLTAEGGHLPDPTFPQARAAGGASQAAAGPGAPGTLTLRWTDPDCTLAKVEQRLIEGLLEHHQGNVSAVARHLGITRGNLRHRMGRLGLAGGDEDEDEDAEDELEAGTDRGDAS